MYHFNETHFSEIYIAPENGRFVGGKLKFLSKDQNDPDKYQPPMNGHPAANYLDPDTNMLWILIKGNEAIDIVTTAVVQVSYNIRLFIGIRGSSC